MPNPATTTGGTSGGNKDGTGKSRSESVGVIPFRRATREHTQPKISHSYTLTGSTQQPPNGVVQLNAYGFLRGVLLTVRSTGGTGGTAFQPDAPFSVLRNISIKEPSGTTIHQFNNGYQAAMYSKHYGWTRNADPRRGIYNESLPDFTYQIFLPLEVDPRTGLGSLPNQNSSAQFQLSYEVAPDSAVYTASPSPQPTITVEIETLHYDQPLPSTDDGVNQQTPPALNTTSFASVQTYSVDSGEFRLRLTRVGNYIRHLGLIWRESGVRTNANFPERLQVDLDARPMTYWQKDTLRQTLYQRYGYDADSFDAPGKQDTGVFWLDFCHEFDGQVGYETRNGWLKTYGSSRLELLGNYGASGTLTVITNDVTIASNVFMG